VPSNNAYVGYWKVYGGFSSLLSSVYAWIAFTITMISDDLWVPPEKGEIPWVSISLSISPSLLGFALGGMAIMLAFSGGLFLNAIRQGGREDSFFMKMIASFFHFALSHTAAMIIGFLCKLTWIPEPLYSILSAVGYFLTLYGILLVAAIAASIWHIARIYNAVREVQPTPPTLNVNSSSPEVTTASK
jgi:hypothetical protein